MVIIKNLKPLLRKFEKLERESRRLDNDNVVVGYAASYAVYVHENKEALHGAKYNAKYAGKTITDKKTGKKRKFKARGSNQQAKFLEQPARQFQQEIRRIIREGAKQGLGLTKAMLVAGMFLQRESQKIVPVEFGNLKGSAFTELDTAFKGIGKVSV